MPVEVAMLVVGFTAAASRVAASMGVAFAETAMRSAVVSGEAVTAGTTVAFAAAPDTLTAGMAAVGQVFR